MRWRGHIAVVPTESANDPISELPDDALLPALISLPGALEPSQHDLLVESVAKFASSGVDLLQEQIGPLRAAHTRFVEAELLLAVVRPLGRGARPLALPPGVAVGVAHFDEVLAVAVGELEQAVRVRHLDAGRARLASSF